MRSKFALALWIILLVEATNLTPDQDWGPCQIPECNCRKAAAQGIDIGPPVGCVSQNLNAEIDTSTPTWITFGGAMPTGGYWWWTFNWHSSFDCPAASFNTCQVCYQTDIQYQDPDDLSWHTMGNPLTAPNSQGTCGWSQTTTWQNTFMSFGQGDDPNQFGQTTYKFEVFMCSRDPVMGCPNYQRKDIIYFDSPPS
jgi:hypothetical protein